MRMPRPPERTCIGCRRVRPACELVCLIAPDGKVRVVCRGRGQAARDESAGKRGRGAWLHPNCLAAAIKTGAMGRAFRKQVEVQGSETLLAQMHFASGRSTNVQGNSPGNTR
jgi:predicted RNA-binding protein YlxR (DUF448 family)